MAAQKSAINLLPKSDFDISLWGRILKWSLTTGRYIIIVTEMVVILAFLSRFKLDKDLSDMHERLDGKIGILNATYDTEVNFRSTQIRLQEAKTLMDNQKDTSALLKHITDKIPQGLVLTSMDADWGKREIALSGVANSQQALAEFMYYMRKDSIWKDPDLTSINSGIDQSINFQASSNF
jgi:hypothetical protein